MLEEVFAQVLVLWLGEYLDAFGYLVLPRLSELHAHLHPMALEVLIHLVPVQLEVVRVVLNILEVGDAVLRTRLLQVVVIGLVEARLVYLLYCLLH